MVNFEERMEFGEKEPRILGVEMGIDMAYRVGKNQKLFFFQCFQEHRAAHFIQ